MLVLQRLPVARQPDQAPSSACTRSKAASQQLAASSKAVQPSSTSCALPVQGRAQLAPGTYSIDPHLDPSTYQVILPQLDDEFERGTFEQWECSQMELRPWSQSGAPSSSSSTAPPSAEERALYCLACSKWATTDRCLTAKHRQRVAYSKDDAAPMDPQVQSAIYRMKCKAIARGGAQLSQVPHREDATSDRCDDEESMLLSAHSARLLQAGDAVGCQDLSASSEGLHSLIGLSPTQPFVPIIEQAGRQAPVALPAPLKLSLSHYMRASRLRRLTQHLSLDSGSGDSRSDGGSVWWQWCVGDLTQIDASSLSAGILTPASLWTIPISQGPFGRPIRGFCSGPDLTPLQQVCRALMVQLSKMRTGLILFMYCQSPFDRWDRVCSMHVHIDCAAVHKDMGQNHGQGAWICLRGGSDLLKLHDGQRTQHVVMHTCGLVGLTCDPCQKPCLQVCVTCLQTFAGLCTPTCVILEHETCLVIHECFCCYVSRCRLLPDVSCVHGLQACPVPLPACSGTPARTQDQVSPGQLLRHGGPRGGPGCKPYLLRPPQCVSYSPMPDTQFDSLPLTYARPVSMQCLHQVTTCLACCLPGIIVRCMALRFGRSLTVNVSLDSAWDSQLQHDHGVTCGNHHAICLLALRMLSGCQPCGAHSLSRSRFVDSACGFESACPHEP